MVVLDAPAPSCRSWWQTRLRCSCRMACMGVWVVPSLRWFMPIVVTVQYQFGTCSCTCWGSHWVYTDTHFGTSVNACLPEIGCPITGIERGISAVATSTSRNLFCNKCRVHDAGPVGLTDPSQHVYVLPVVSAPGPHALSCRQALSTSTSLQSSQPPMPPVL